MSPSKRHSARRLAETIAFDLLSRDGIAVIWQVHLAAARAYRDGHRRAAENLIEIADAAEEAWWQATRSSAAST